MTEAQVAIVARRAAKQAAKQAAKRAEAARAARAARAQMKAEAEKNSKAAALAEIEKRNLTRWRKGAKSEPSGYAGGKSLCNYDWLLAEKQAHAAAGIAAEIVEHPAKPGWFALAKGNTKREAR